MFHAKKFLLKINSCMIFQLGVEKMIKYRTFIFPLVNTLINHNNNKILLYLCKNLLWKS